MDDPPTPHTYEQAAEVLGIQAEAVRARLRRGALRRGPRTNDNRPTVLLSPADIATIRSGVRPAGHPESGPESGPGPGLDAGDIKDLLDLVKAQLERAQADADLARAALTLERERWEGRLDALTAVLGEERQARATADAARALAEVEAARLRGELDRLQARPWWRRLLGGG